MTTQLLAMKTKLFEIRDKATFIPVVAIQCFPENEAERYLLSRSGYGTFPTGEWVIMCKLECSGTQRNATYDCHSWGDRTMQVAHGYIEKNWRKLNTGDVVDVEFILGETKEPKVSEAVEA